MEESSLGEHSTSLQCAQFQEKENLFSRKLVLWHSAITVYIPAITQLQGRGEGDESEILLPSIIGNRVPWDKQLGEYEWLLRLAQAHDTLDKIRETLRLKTFLLKKKKDWDRGVRANTRSQTEIKKTDKKKAMYASKYRHACNALSVLALALGKGDDWALEYQLLHDDDIRPLPYEGLGEGTRTLSWIWTTSGVSENDEPQLIDGE